MSTRQTVSNESLYWAILDVGALPPSSGTKRREQLGFLFERYVPRPIEQIHCAYAQVDDNRVLACGIDCEQLDAVTALTLTPDLIPAGIVELIDSPSDPLSLNLLTGRFEPVRVRALRRRWISQLCATAILAFILLVVGVERRVQAARATSSNAMAEIAKTHEQVLGPSSDGGPQFSRMTGELRRLRSTRQAKGDLIAHDPTPSLAVWLASWPAEPPMQTHSIVASESAMTITTNAHSNDEAQVLIESMRPPPNWVLAQPTLSKTAQGIRLLLRAEMEAGS